MPSETITNPPAGTWGAFHVGDTDTRSKDFTPDLSTIPDTIASVSNVVITRMDGVQMGASDLTLVAQAGIDPTNMIVTLQFDKGVGGVQYDVAIQIQTVGGRTITRDTLMLVSGSVG